MKLLVSKRISFDAAHFLPNYEGPCRNIHGHHWKVELAVKGEVNEDGMVIDFAELKKFLSFVEETFDHKLINNIITNPTAENIALWIEDKFKLWETDIRLNKRINISFAHIRVWETEDSMVEL